MSCEAKVHSRVTAAIVLSRAVEVTGCARVVKDEISRAFFEHALAKGAMKLDCRR